MAELVLSALLPLLFEKLTSATMKTIARHNGFDAEIKKWRRSLTQIQGVLTDASQQEASKKHVKRWLLDLQHLAYDIDDVLDELATEAMHLEYNNESEGISSKVRKLIPSCCTNFSRNTTLLNKLDDITAKLKDLIDEKVALGLRVLEEDQPRSKNKNRRETTSLYDASRIVGRHFEKDALVRELLGGESSHQNFSIVPIVGMGGVGKTTLAKLVYDDNQVKDRFELKAWVYVSKDFDSFAISKVIFETVKKENKDFASLNLLQVDLRDHLTGKRFLLVLDDVWSESSKDWEMLVAPFHACASGSKIIITTRKDQLLKKLRCKQINQLQSLSPEIALSLIAQQALGEPNFDSHLHLSLKPHAVGIVKKCCGLPLALKALGGLLSTKTDEEHWKKVLDSEMWNLPVVEGEIIPELKLSYHDLSARLKQLFAYCSLFPKGCVFDKEELVLLWMAEGFLHMSPSDDSTEESMGREYFDELFSRSFFQHAPNNKSQFVMHDMMNDLATCVASEFFVRLDNKTENSSRGELLEKYRHMSFVREEYVTYKKFENFKRAKSLRTFLATSIWEVESSRMFYLSNKIMVDLLVELPLLRVLCLSGFKLSEVPEYIGTLRHLRYLNLSRTRITHLPESVCNLYNLQTLIICDCYELTKLPNNFLKLKNLRHLNIQDTPLLNKMPLGISDLKNLQTLSKIIIGDESGFEIAKLKEFKNLCGRISIMGLEKMKNAINAREANFSKKRFIELDLVWSDGSRNEMLEKDVLNELKPCDAKLIQLQIRSYGGLEFPNWVGDPSFLLLKYVTIRDCKRCTSLPALGQLPVLKELFIEGLDGVKIVGMELLGSCHEFASLEILWFEHMTGWTKWSTNRGVVFPCLKELIIKDCPNLVEVTLEALPSLNVLKIRQCDSVVLKKLVQVASAVTQLEIESISGLNDVVWRCAIKYFGAIEKLTIWSCSEIRYLWESEAVASKLFVNLKKIKVNKCENLVSLGEEEDEDNCRSNLLTSLRTLRVYGCKNMERCKCPYNIEKLDVSFCDSITVVSLPTEWKMLNSLRISDCEKLVEREWGGQKMNNRMLKDVSIHDRSNLKSITQLKYLVHLTQLNISNCKGLESFPDNELSNLTSLKKLSIYDCPGMDGCFPRGIWPPNLHSLTIGNLKKPMLEWGPQNFPSSLVELNLYDDDGVSSLGQISHLLPSSLIELHIFGFERLESADEIGLQHLTSLQHLEFYNCPNLHKLSLPQHLTSIKRLSFEECPNLSMLSHPQHLTSLQHLHFYNCPKMKDLPEALFPSLLSLRIRGDCSEGLQERCSKGGSYWPLISHIPNIKIHNTF